MDPAILTRLLSAIGWRLVAVQAEAPPPRCRDCGAPELATTRLCLGCLGDHGI